MRLFRKKAESAVKTQIRQRERHPFAALQGYVPLGEGEIRLYRAIREAVPVVDAAILKIIRLTGGFTVPCSNSRAEYELAQFLRTVNTGRGGYGINSFIDAYLDSMITCGRAVGEIVTDGNRDIAAVLCGNVQDVSILEGKSPLDFKICLNDGLEPRPLPYQDLLMFTPFNPEADRPYGTSMLRSMPFLTDILMKIYTSIGINWDRFGNLRYAVICKPSGEILDRGTAGQRAETIAQQWSEAMNDSKNGSVRDFVAVGDVDIKVIGADNKTLDSEVPVRQILEQLVARTGIPPFMLGLNWSSTERMSTQQADLMTSEIAAIRRSLTPMLEKICSLWLKMHGYSCDFEVDWDFVNLQDIVEVSTAELYSAQAKQVLHNIGEEEEESEYL